jgi:hypothetical protein
MKTINKASSLFISFQKAEKIASAMSVSIFISPEVRASPIMFHPDPGGSEGGHD